jgi:hypothetical protein
MTHDRLMRYERLYMELASRPRLTKEEKSTLHGIQKMLRDHKQAWEAQ